MLDLQVLRLIWWALLGVLLIGFAVTDGFDLGVAALLPFVTRNKIERNLVINTLKPVWEGNQVWLILGAGSIFAAWPYVYAVAFSGAYFVVLLLLLTIGISRPVSFKYRNKMESLCWQRFWDWIVFIGGFAPAIILGMLVGNVLLGLPFYFDSSLRIFYSGTFADLFSPFAIWCGLTSLAMLLMHGGIYLAAKSDDPIRRRAIVGSRVAACLLLLLFSGGGILIATRVMGYQVLSPIDPYGYSNPLHKEVGAAIGAWLINYVRYPLSMLAPLFGFLGALGAILTASWGNSRIAFLCSSISIAGVICTVGVSMFPFILPSSTNLSSSLLVWDASSTELTLLVMLISVIIFLPIVLLYTAWVYRVLRGKVKKVTLEVEGEGHSY